jgi:hypothetical protein
MATDAADLCSEAKTGSGRRIGKLTRLTQLRHLLDQRGYKKAPDNAGALSSWEIKEVSSAPRPEPRPRRFTFVRLRRNTNVTEVPSKRPVTLIWIKQV